VENLKIYLRKVEIDIFLKKIFVFEKIVFLLCTKFNLIFQRIVMGTLVL